jgi:hypothetical protein
MVKRCPVCDTEFESHKLSQKYCSEDCRLVRVRENDRIRKRKERAEEKAIREKEKQRIKQAKAEAREKEDAKRTSEQQAELEKKAAQGDALARMRIAKPNSKEYWEAYKDYEIEYAESWGRESTRTVNDISVHEPNFGRKVVEAIKELGIIRTKL